MTAWLLGIGVSLIIIAIHYEAMAFVSWVWHRVETSNRAMVMFAMSVLFFAHLIEVQIFALAYYAAAEWAALGSLTGVPIEGFRTYGYFSAVTYTSVGYGELVALGGLRVIAGIEALMGLLMIAWSGAFTVFLMQKRWE